MDRLQELLADGVIDEVYNQLKSGKEAEVWLVSHRGEPVAAKIYKAREFRSFKNDAGYKEGRQVRNTRTQRAMNKGSKFGREAAEEAWKSAEADAMFELHAAGVKVPKPVLFYEGVLLMEVIGDAEGRVAPRLVDAAITQEQAGPMYLFLRGEIIKILAADWIHGDLSEFNILLGKDGPVIIDFPQVVTAAKNSRSEQFFRRDIGNMVRFFSAIDPALAKYATDADEIWRAYVRRDLSPHFVPTGRVFSGPPQRGGPPRNDRRGPPPGGQQQGGRPQNARTDQRGPQQPRSDQAGPRVEHRGLPQAGSGYRADQRNPPAPAQQQLSREGSAPLAQQRRDAQRGPRVEQRGSPQQQQLGRSGGTPGDSQNPSNREPRIEHRGSPQQQQPSSGATPGEQPSQNPRNREPRVDHRGSMQQSGRSAATPGASQNPSNREPRVEHRGSPGEQPSQNPRNREPRVDHRGSPPQPPPNRTPGEQPSQNPRNREPRVDHRGSPPPPPRSGTSGEQPSQNQHRNSPQQQQPRNGGTPGDSQNPRNREPRVEHRGAPQQQQPAGEQPTQNPRNREPRAPQQSQRRGPEVGFRGPSSAGPSGGEPRRGGGAGRRRPPRRF